MSILNKWVPIRDSREKPGNGFFEGSPHVKVIGLDFGDYTVGSDYDIHSDLVIVERKQSGDELCGNLAQFRARFERELSRMQETKFKLLVIEQNLTQVLNPTFSRVNWRYILSSLIDFYLDYGVVPIFCGDSLMAERFVSCLFQRVAKKENAEFSEDWKGYGKP